MSQHNVEVANALLPAPLDLVAVFATTEALDGARTQFEHLIDPHLVTVHDPSAAPLGIGNPTAQGTTVGIEGFISLWRDYLSAWDSWVVTPIDVVDVDDQRVLALMDYDGRSKTHGAEITLAGGNLLTVRDGKLTRLELFFRRQDALKAAGLLE